MTDPNVAPTSVNNTMSLNEDAVYTISPAAFPFADADGDSRVGVRIDTLPDDGQLLFGGQPVTAGSVIQTSDMRSGLLTFVPDLDEFGRPYTTFDFSVFDGKDFADQASTMLVIVRSLDDEPSTSDFTVDTLEDTDYSFDWSQFSYSDGDGDVQTGLTIESLPSEGVLTVNGTTATAGQFISVAEMPTTTLVFSPEADEFASPYTSFEFSVNDGTLDSETATVTINVLPVNDPPTTGDSSVTTPEDTAYTFLVGNFPFADIDPGDGLGSVRVDSLPGDGILSHDGTAVTSGQVIPSADIVDGKLTFTPDADENGSPYTTFQFNVSDSASSFAQTGAVMTINVTAENDAPDTSDTSITIVEDTTHVFTSGDFPFSDIDVGDQLASVRIVSLPDQGVLTLGGNAVTAGSEIATGNLGNLFFTPEIDENGSPYTSFQFRVSDSELESDPPATMTINVTPADDAPTGSDFGVTILEDHSYVFGSSEFDFQDADEGDLLASVTVSPPTAGELRLSGTPISSDSVVSVADLDSGLLVYVPPADAYGDDYATVNFTVSDGTLSSSPGNLLTVDVTAVNDAPTLETSESSLSVSPGSVLAMTMFSLATSTRAAKMFD